MSTKNASFSEKVKKRVEMFKVLVYNKYVFSEERKR